MNFIYLANVRMPTEKAHGIQIVKTCEALTGQGATVTLIVPARKNKIIQNPFEFYNLEKKFTITKLWCLDLISLNVFGSLGFWIESVTFFRSIKKYVAKQPTGIYYTRDLALAYWLSKEKSVYYEIHDLPEKTDMHHHEVWNRAKGLVVISNGLKEELMRRGVSEEKILVAHDAVDLKDFVITESKKECREKLHLPLDKKIVVYTGHLYEWKGAHILAEAAQSLEPHVEVYVVGGTTKDVRNFKIRYHASNLHVIGFRSHHEMVYWQKAADLLVLPTSAKTLAGERYTSPLKLFEYLASGTPIIVSDSPAMREILTDNMAFFVPPDNTKALTQGIQELLRNKAKYDTLRVTMNRLNGDFSWENRARLILDFVS